MSESIDPPPTPTAIDKSIEVGAALVAEFPGGGVFAEFFRQWMGTPYQRRMDAWLRAVHALLLELQTRDVDIEALAEREGFVTAMHDASRIALGEHLEAKIELLKAVLFNAATHRPDDLADLWTLRYLRWIDDLEPQHIAVLRFATGPREWLDDHGRDAPTYMSGSRRTVLDLAEFPFPKEQLDLVLEDLAALRLGDIGTGMVTGNAMYDPWISDRGRRFLDWLTIV